MKDDKPVRVNYEAFSKGRVKDLFVQLVSLLACIGFSILTHLKVWNEADQRNMIERGNRLVEMYSKLADGEGVFEKLIFHLATLAPVFYDLTFVFQNRPAFPVQVIGDLGRRFANLNVRLRSGDILVVIKVAKPAPCALQCAIVGEEERMNLTCAHVTIPVEGTQYLKVTIRDLK